MTSALRTPNGRSAALRRPGAAAAGAGRWAATTELAPNLALDREVSRRLSRGEEVLHFGFGESRLPLLPELADSLTRGAARTDYGPVAGHRDPRSAVAGYFARRGLPTAPDQIVMAPGSKPLLLAILAVIPGDVVLPTPSWVTYAPQARLLGRRVIGVPIPPQAGGVPDPARLADALQRARRRGERPGVLILTTPDNPTGTFASSALITEVMAVARAEGLRVISDEIYRDIVFDPAQPFLSPADVEPQRTIVTTGLSKSLSLGGWRIGAARFPTGRWGRRTRESVTAAASQIWSNLAGPMQSVAAYAFGEPDEVLAYREASTRLHGRFAVAVHQRMIAAGAEARTPTAGFYVYPDFEPMRDRLRGIGITDSSSLADHLLERHGLAVLAGVHFGDDPDALRFRMATSMLYGADDAQMLAALTADDPLALPHIAHPLDRLSQILADLADTAAPIRPSSAAGGTPAVGSAPASAAPVVAAARAGGTGLRTRAAVAAGRGASGLSTRLRLGSGTVAGGHIALWLDPHLLQHLTQERHVVLVSGTNGKTTTTRMTADALRTLGPVVSNTTGANMPEGLAMALSSDPAAPVAVLEVDEMYLADVAAATRPQAVVLLNLSREFTRGVSLGRTLAAWRRLPAELPEDCRIIANADDPLIVAAVAGAVDPMWVAGGAAWEADAVLCPDCGAPLRLAERPAAGFSCPHCGLRRPAPAWWREDGKIFAPGFSRELSLAAPGDWLVSNALFAVAAATALGAQPDAAVAAVAAVDDVDGRYRLHRRGEHDVRISMVKNPASWAQALQLAEEPGHLVLVLDHFGVKDATPLWSVPIGSPEFPAERFGRVTVSGQRCLDLAARLEVAGVGFTVEPDPVTAIDAAPPGPVHVVANYSALSALKKRLRP